MTLTLLATQLLLRIQLEILVSVQTNDAATGDRLLPSANPFITAGIISKNSVQIFTPPDAKISTRRKRPLRTKSNAHVMTSHEVIADLQSQQQKIDARNAKKRGGCSMYI